MAVSPRSQICASICRMAALLPVPESPITRKCIASRWRGTRTQRLAFFLNSQSTERSSFTNARPSASWRPLNSAVVTSSGPRNRRPCFNISARRRSFGRASNNSTTKMPSAA